MSKNVNPYFVIFVASPVKQSARPDGALPQAAGSFPSQVAVLQVAASVPPPGGALGPSPAIAPGRGAGRDRRCRPDTRTGTAADATAAVAGTTDRDQGCHWSGESQGILQFVREIWDLLKVREI